MHVHIISFIFASTIIIHLYQCSVLGGKHWDGNLKTPEEVAVRMTRGTLHAACYDHCYVIHAIVPARTRSTCAGPKIVLVPPYLSIYFFVRTWMIIMPFIVDTLVSTIGLPPLQNGRRHFSPLILHLEWTAILTRLLRGPYLDLETPLIPPEQLLSKSESHPKNRQKSHFVQS